ncbi:hypothetical protein OR16_30714 [Cupriavidus basilensis OR16]|uniref:DUF1484 domain-containing protein n=1 Tax=Cupriavidus basilensis OR16 TaxID=1127483 RepID=H1SD23_9BURK|nr:DUF1484 family protein [Cupriavidus basilensis]EHP39569.1 hypothetical protein OR16_30714 [Cupriavidus basilensis OR16]
MDARSKTLVPATDPSEPGMLAEPLLPKETAVPQDDPKREAIMRSFDELLRVRAGLGAILTLLDLQADASIDCIGLHSLLASLQQQLDASVDRLDELF